MKIDYKQAPVYIIAGVMLAAVASFIFSKETSDLPFKQKDLNAICQSVKGCKSLKLGFSYGWLTTAGKFSVVGAKKVKGEEFETSIGTAVLELVKRKDHWLNASLDTQNIEVRYE